MDSEIEETQKKKHRLRAGIKERDTKRNTTETSERDLCRQFLEMSRDRGEKRISITKEMGKVGGKTGRRRGGGGGGVGGRGDEEEEERKEGGAEENRKKKKEEQEIETK